MNRYARYKDSGIPWLGEVPEHWEIVPIRHLFQFKNNLRVPLSAEERGKIIEKIYPYYGASGIIDYVDNFIFDEDLILVAEDGANLLSRSTPLAFIATGKYWVNNHAHILKPLSRIIKFWQYLLQIYDFSPLISGSAQPKLTKDNLASILLPSPTVEEQIAIAHYLDTKLGEIDALIGKQQTLLEKLAEQRTAVITHAVTKGLNPTAPMKNSGVEWLGDVPAHWEVLSIKRLSQVKRGASPRPIDNPDYFDDDGEYAWVRIADVTASNMYLLETTQRLSDLGKSFSVPLLPNSLFLSIAGSVGKPIITKIKACIHDGFVYFPEYKNNIKFLYYIFYSGQPYLGLGKMGTQLNLNTDTVGTIKISLPPKEEQTAITDYLDQETAKIDRLCDTVNQTIGRLKEYRTALITQAVTGKIKITDE